MTATIHDLPAPQATTTPMSREEWLLDLGAIFLAYGMSTETMRARGVLVFTQMADAVEEAALALA